jgi:NitT/TauT family transport system permease protein
VLQGGYGSVVGGDLVSSLVGTLVTFGIGLASAIVLGVLAGGLLGASKILYEASHVSIELIRPIPSVALIPFAILVLGLGQTMSVSIVLFAAVWPIVYNTYYGIRGTDSVALDTARSFGLGSVARFFRVAVPSSLSSIMSGIRISAAIALILTVTVELVSGTVGMGYFILIMNSALRVPRMYAGVLVVGLVGYLVNLVFRSLERHIVFWKA